jgi:hypothetical protein
MKPAYRTGKHWAFMEKIIHSISLLHAGTKRKTYVSNKTPEFSQPKVGL